MRLGTACDPTRTLGSVVALPKPYWKSYNHLPTLRGAELRSGREFISLFWGVVAALRRMQVAGSPRSFGTQTVLMRWSNEATRFRDSCWGHCRSGHDG